ncbi:hypothetical protein [Ruania albidiflava]|uniref:hypothetical protein n=1 Tax=Ruania albidiflava TaxID=366586 RepID=UPI0023F07BA2|nr:hypothetical protein [Ruania albidiflava]
MPAARAPVPLIPEDVIEGLDAAVTAEPDPVASTSTQTEGLPSGATLDVLQLERTGSSGYLLRVRLSWPEETSLSPEQHKSLSLDGDQHFVDGLRLVDPEAERFVPPTGQILNARYGPLGGESEPEALTLEVPGFEPIAQIPVTEG